MQNCTDSWTAALFRGDFDAAWATCDDVLADRLTRNEQCSDWPREHQFIWRGQPFANRRVLIRCYHDMGDTIQFIRFAAPLRRIAREVTVWVQPELLSLIATAPGVDRVSAIHDGKPEFLYDVDIESLELGHALRATAESVSSYVPYLFPRMISRVPSAGGEQLKVGLIWRNGQATADHCIPVQELRTLQHVEGIELYSLQYPAGGDELSALGANDLACKEIELLASRMQRLDLIIAVDSYSAHLAGAMGLPVWTLLPADCDWRWMHERSDTPWYPTMRLFRQAQLGDWSAVMEDVVASLQEHV
ncbi:MAG: ADP-heptose--LPS heptosyltransferase, partial [Steroidobacteraceae bacterium]